MLKDFTWSRFLGKVVIELLPKICASLIAGYLLMAQPWKTETPAASPPPALTAAADPTGVKPAELIAEAHVAPLASPATRPSPGLEVEEAVPAPTPKPGLRRSVKERQYTAQVAAANPTKSVTATLRPQSVQLVAAKDAPLPESKPEVKDASLADKVLSVGDGAVDLAKRGSARILDVPVTAYQYGRDAVGKVTGAVASVLPFTR